MSQPKPGEIWIGKIGGDTPRYLMIGLDDRGAMVYKNLEKNSIHTTSPVTYDWENCYRKEKKIIKGWALISPNNFWSSKEKAMEISYPKDWKIVEVSYEED